MINGEKGLITGMIGAGRLVIAIIIQTAVIVAAACAFYFSLKSDIRDLVTKREENEKYWQLKFDQMQIQNQLLQKQIDALGVRIDDMEAAKNVR